MLLVPIVLPGKPPPLERPCLGERLPRLVCCPVLCRIVRFWVRHKETELTTLVCFEWVF